MTSPSERIDPQLAEALAAVPKTAMGGVFDLNDLAGTRAAIHAMADAAAQTPNQAVVSIEVHEAHRTDGPPVPIRLFRPVGRPGPLPALLWFHGGGQVLGFAAQEDPFLSQIVQEVGCVVVSVDYRLAPEAPAPAAAEDGYPHIFGCAQRR